MGVVTHLFLVHGALIHLFGGQLKSPWLRVKLGKRAFVQEIGKKVSSLCCSIKYAHKVPDVFAENVQIFETWRTLDLTSIYMLTILVILR